MELHVDLSGCMGLERHGASEELLGSLVAALPGTTSLSLEVRRGTAAVSGDRRSGRRRRLLALS